MSTLTDDGSGEAESLISIFSFLSSPPLQPSGDALLSRKSLYSLLAKMPFSKTYLLNPVRAGKR